MQAERIATARVASLYDLFARERAAAFRLRAADDLFGLAHATSEREQHDGESQHASTLRYEQRVLLFKKPFWDGLQSGAITLTYRRWQKPHVKPRGRYRCHPIGVLEVDAIELVSVGSITAEDATRAGFPSRDGLVAYLAELGPVEASTEVYRVELHHGGDGDRVELALETALTDDDIEAIRAKLKKLGKWTGKTLAIIDAQPRIAASKLAKQLRRETLPFKEDVRKLKKLGLTQSFEVGYEISPRGRAYLEATMAKAKKTTTTKTTKAKPKAAPKTAKASGAGTKAKPWKLKTPPGSSSFEAYRDGDKLHVQVGSTKLEYQARCIEDLHAMLKKHGDWMPLGAADENKPAADGTVEAWGRSGDNPVGGWYGLKKNFRGRFGMYVPPVLEALGLAEVEHEARNNRMRAK